jgi:hypothetical protein
VELSRVVCGAQSRAHVELRAAISCLRPSIIFAWLPMAVNHCDYIYTDDSNKAGESDDYLTLMCSTVILIKRPRLDIEYVRSQSFQMLTATIRMCLISSASWAFPFLVLSQGETVALPVTMTWAPNNNISSSPASHLKSSRNSSIRFFASSLFVFFLSILSVASFCFLTCNFSSASSTLSFMMK